MPAVADKQISTGAVKSISTKLGLFAPITKSVFQVTKIREISLRRTSTGQSRRLALNLINPSENNNSRRKNIGRWKAIGERNTIANAFILDETS
jgi:hypothetical protein